MPIQTVAHRMFRLCFCMMLVAGGVSPGQAQSDGLSEGRLGRERGGTARWTAQVIESGPDHRVWERRAAQDPGYDGGAASSSRFVELATGLNRFDGQSRKWVAARPEFEVTRGGEFVARQTQHQVILAPTVNVTGAVDLLTPDGVRLRSTIVGLAAVDAVSGRSVMLAEVRPSRGQRVSPSEVAYPDAFDSLVMDVRYRLTLDGFEQDVVMRRRIPGAFLTELGLNPATTRLVVLTEFFEAPSAVRVSQRTTPADAADMADHRIEFGRMVLGEGRAFVAGEDGSGLPVAKSWENLEGRRFLIEAISYPRLARLLERLPTPPQGRLDRARSRVHDQAAAGSPASISTTSALLAVLPRPVKEVPDRRSRAGGPRLKAERSEPGRALAALGSRGSSELSPEAAVVLDYPMQISAPSTDLVLQGGTTYYVSGRLQVAGRLILRGGTVVKFANSPLAGMVCQGAVVCETGPFQPAIFTSRDDDTVGECISGSTGVPSTADVTDPVLTLYSVGQDLHDLRVAHARVGLFFHEYSASQHAVRHVQFVRCGTALRINGDGLATQNLDVFNALFTDVDLAVTGFSYAVRGEHWTVNRCRQLTEDLGLPRSSPPAQVYLVNGILAEVAGMGNAQLTPTVVRTYSDAALAFRSTGAGSAYLGDATARDAGTDAIDPGLACELRERTTHPPVFLTGAGAGNTVWRPQVARDTGLLDLGFHYDPVDFAIRSVTVQSGATLRVLAGTVVAVAGGLGVQAEAGSQVFLEGVPGQPVRWYPIQSCQEQSRFCGESTSSAVLLAGSGTSASDPQNGPTLTARHLESALIGGCGLILQADQAASVFRKVDAQDCQFGAGSILLGGPVGSEVRAANNLFQGTALVVSGGGSVEAFNGLWYGGSSRWQRGTTAGSWIVRDCVFQEHSLWDSGGGIVAQCLAYAGASSGRFVAADPGTIVLSAFVYAPGPLGAFYQASTNFVDRGSRSAAEAGLYHHTTAIGQTPEGTSRVDLGFHYPAMTVQGDRAVALDTDADGTSNLEEDGNGDGQTGGGETDWRSGEDGGVHVRIRRPAPGELLR